MDAFERILAVAQGVKRLGPDRAIFRSPTREDRTASVSLARGANGVVLLHDFGGDSPADILAHFSMTLADLFERPRRDMTAAEKSELRTHGRIAGWSAALGVLDYETCLVLVAARDLAAGNTLSAGDHERLQVAAQRIHGARETLCPAPRYRPREVSP